MFQDMEKQTTPEQRPIVQKIAVAHCVFDLIKPPSYAYFLLTPPASDLGVCHYAKLDYTPLFSADRKYLGKHSAVDLRPQQYMTLADDPCPPLNNDAYINADQVPPGVFASLMHFWQTIMTSPVALEGAAAQLTPQERHSYSYEMLQEMARDYKKQPATPWAIELSTNDLAFQRPHGDTLDYRVCVDSMCLAVDLTDQGWRIIRFDSFGLESPKPPAHLTK